MKILYIDPVFGISGDMMISAFIDAGLPFSELKDALDAIPLALPAITPARRFSTVSIWISRIPTSTSLLMKWKRRLRA
jgi:uncharacterized protein (DUF111 family)